MKIHIFILTFFIGFTSFCQKDYYPEKNENQSQKQYDYYLNYLKKEYSKNDSFEIGILLSNLYVNSDTIYKYIDKGINTDTQKCKRIFKFYYFYKVANFKTKLIKSDTAKFINSFNLCLQLLGENSYEEDLLMKKIKVKQKNIALMKDIDTTKFDNKLILELEQILLDDTKYRMQPNFSATDNKLIQKQQRKLDSINFNKIDEILLNGYPTPQKIGIKHLFTVWLVLQHQTNYKKRLKYTHLLEKALKDSLISNSQLNIYKLRTEKIIKFSKNRDY